MLTRITRNITMTRMASFSSSNKPKSAYERGSSRFRPNPAAEKSSLPFRARTPMERKLYHSRMKTKVMQNVLIPFKNLVTDWQFMIRFVGFTGLLWCLYTMAEERSSQGVPFKIIVKDDGDELSNKYSKTLGREKQLDAILTQLNEEDEK